MKTISRNEIKKEFSKADLPFNNKKINMTKQTFIKGKLQNNISRLPRLEKKLCYETGRNTKKSLTRLIELTKIKIQELKQGILREDSLYFFENQARFSEIASLEYIGY